MNTKSAEFRKKKSTWQTIGVPAPSSADQAAADAILESAAAESKSRAQQDANEDAPTTVEIDNDDEVNEAQIVRMESGAHAGLQTAEQVSAQIRRREAEERRQQKKDAAEAKANGNTNGKEQDTIYRDASGRIINVAMKRAEARRKLETEAAQAQAEKEAQKGDVQRLEKEKRREDLQDAKFMTVARYADDVDMNEELKQRERWNDPAAGFLSSSSAAPGAKGKGGKSVSGKPLYRGAAEPNRYGIRPGYRWDGVDRSTGFEKEYFKARNRRENVKNLEYAWQMDE